MHWLERLVINAWYEGSEDVLRTYVALVALSIDCQFYLDVHRLVSPHGIQ